MTPSTNMPDSDNGQPAPSMAPALLLGMAAFLANFDVTAVVIALPAVARQLGFGVAGYALGIEAHTFGFSGALLFCWAVGGPDWPRGGVSPRHLPFFLP